MREYKILYCEKCGEPYKEIIGSKSQYNLCEVCMDPVWDELIRKVIFEKDTE